MSALPHLHADFNLAGNPKKLGTWYECARACNDNTQCRAWGFNTKDYTCW